MVERDHGCGFGHAVTLNENEADGVPEFLYRWEQRAAAADDGPELEAEGAVYAAEAPPAQWEWDAGGHDFGADGELGEAGDVGFKMSLEEGDDAGDGGKDGDSLAANGFDEARRGGTAFQMKLGAVDVGDPESQHLAEDMAQGQREQDAEGMDDALIAHVRLR